MVRSKGLAGASVTALIAESGLSERYFYESFASVDQILAEVFLGVRREAHVLIRDAARTAAGPDSAIRAVTGLLADRASADRLLPELAFAEVSGMPLLKQGRDEMRAFFKDLMQESATQYLGAPETDRQVKRYEHASLMLSSGLLEVLSLWVDKELDLSRDEFVDFSTDLIDQSRAGAQQRRSD